MGISLLLEEETLYRIYQEFYDHEATYAMEADDLMRSGGEWEPIENIAGLFAGAADELFDFEEKDDPDYALLSELVEKAESCPEGDYPRFFKSYSEDGKPAD